MKELEMYIYDRLEDNKDWVEGNNRAAELMREIQLHRDRLAGELDRAYIDQIDKMIAMGYRIAYYQNAKAYVLGLYDGIELERKVVR